MSGGEWQFFIFVLHLTNTCCFPSRQGTVMWSGTGVQDDGCALVILVIWSPGCLKTKLPLGSASSLEKVFNGSRNKREKERMWEIIASKSSIAFFFFQNGFKPTRTKSAMQSVDQRCNLHVTVFVNETSATLWLLKSWPRRQAAARWQSPHDSHPIHMKRNSSQRHCEQTLHFKSTLLASRAGAYTCIVTWSCETFTTCPFCTQAVILHATHCVLKWLCVCCMYINVRAVAARTEHLQHKRQEVSPCHKQQPPSVGDGLWGAAFVKAVS